MYPLGRPVILQRFTPRVDTLFTLGSPDALRALRLAINLFDLMIFDFLAMIILLSQMVSLIFAKVKNSLCLS